MPAPYELSTWVFPPGNSKRPVVVRDQEVRIYLRALAEDGSPGTPTGLRLEVRRPDGSIQVIDGGDVATGEEAGTFYAVVQADQNRLWRYEWIHTGPVEGHMNGSFTVQAGTVQPPGESSPVLVTEDLDPLATEGGGTLRVKRIPALPVAAGIGGLEVVGAQAGETKKARLDHAIGTWVIQGVGVPVADYVHGTTVLPDDTAAITNGIAVGRAFGFTRIATVGVVVAMLGVVTNLKGTILTNSVGIDVQDAVSGASGYHKLPHWQLGPAAKIAGTGGAMRVEDFVAISTGWTPVAPGADPVLDNTAQRAALTHQIRGYAGACLEWRGDGNAVVRSAILGFVRPWDFSQGGRHHWDSVIIDVGGTMDQYGIGFRLTRSGGAPRGRACHVVTLGIKNVTGVNALDHVILAAEQVTTGPHAGQTRIRIGPCFYLKYKVWQAAREVSKGDQRVVNYSADPLNINLHLFEVKRRGDWVTGQVAPGTGTTLTEAHIGSLFSDGAVEWEYLGPYTGVRFDANRPAAYLLAKESNPAGAWGHRVVINADAPTLYDRETNDPRQAGHYEVLSIGAGDATQQDIVIGRAWQADLATALPGGFMAIHPGMRIAKSIETDTSDGLYIDGWTSKGPIFWGDIYTSNAVMVDCSGEAPTEGEYGRDAVQYRGWYLGKGAAGLVMIGGGNKNMGRPLIIDTDSEQPVEFVAKENAGGALDGIRVKSGVLRVSGGHLRGFAMRIRVEDGAVADLSGLTTAPGLEIAGTGKVIPPRSHVAGPAEGRQVFAGPGLMEIGPAWQPPMWTPLTVVAVGAKQRVRGTQGDIWRLRCSSPGTTGAAAPAISRSKKQRQNSTAYAVGKDLWLTGSDGNAHLVQVASLVGPGLSGASPPVVTDATTTITDGDLTLRRISRYQGPGAPVPDGTAVWTIEDLHLGVQGMLSIDPETGVGELASFTGGGNRNVRLRWAEALGLEVDSLYHIGSARPLVSGRGDYRPRRRTLAQITTNDADPAAGNLSRLVLATDAEGGEALAHATDNGAAVVYARQDYVAAQIAGGLSAAGYPSPAVMTWVGNTTPMPPQAFNAQAGDPTLTAQQSILSSWLLACQDDGRAAYLPTGIYRLSGATPTATMTRVPVVLCGDGPRRSIIWMDDTYSGGAALRFDDIWWGATEVPLPANMQPVEADGYVFGAPPLTSGQSFRGGLLLADFSVIGQMTSLTTKAWLDGSLGQRGIDFDRRLDNAYLGRLAFANIQGQALRYRPSTATTVGPRETTIEVIETRQCGWGGAKPAIDILNDRADAGGSDQVTMRRIKCANNHGPSLRIQHNGGAGTASFNHWLVEDFLVHGEGSWNAGGVGYDAAIPLPGGAPWHHLEFLGAIDAMRAVNIRTGHNIKGRLGAPDAFCIRVAAVGGAVPNGLLLGAQNRDSGEKFLLIEAGAGIRCEISSAEGGLVEVGAGVTGPIEILPPPGEELNLTVATAARDLVVLGEHDPSGRLPLRAPAHVSRVQQAVGSTKTFRREEWVLAARTSASNTTTGFTALKDAHVGVLGGEAKAAQPIPVPAGSLTIMVYRAHGNSTAAQRAEWTGAVLVQRLTDAASTTILAGPGASAIPTSGAGATGNAARLSVVANTSIGGVDFGVTWGGGADHTLFIEALTVAGVLAGNLAHMQAALMRRAAPMLAGLSDPTLPGPFADDTAAGAGGVTSGQKYLTTSGQVATKL